MTDTVIRVENLGKKYAIDHQQPERYTSLRDVIANQIKSLTHRLTRYPHAGKPFVAREEFWALKDISFEIKQGDRVGVIGRNGAGKSTLLKILSRITEPTRGRATIKGRVASLLEVGTGFHPELTGRENIYLNGAILGMGKAEIKQKFDEIVAFAEVEKFLDTPVKRYSSGMYVRLAFAVAAHLEPEILVVDEVLAVGDLQFQEKCLGKMNQVAESGRTVFFVSHNMGAIKALCKQALLLELGQIKSHGASQDVVLDYIKLFSDRTTTGQIDRRQHVQGNSKVTIEKVELCDRNQVAKTSFLIGESFTIQLTYDVHEELEGSFWILISSLEGAVILSSFQKDNYAPVNLTSDGVVSIHINSTQFLPGSYLISAGLFSKTEIIDWTEHVMRFEILPQFVDSRPFDYRYGFLTQEFTWEIKDNSISSDRNY